MAELVDTDVCSWACGDGSELPAVGLGGLGERLGRGLRSGLPGRQHRERSGGRRFDDFQARLGIARNVLQSRLTRLVDEGVVRRVEYQERPKRFEYRLTSKGVDLWPVLVALLKWGDRHAFPDGPPVVLRHAGCGGELDDHRVCGKCGKPLEANEVAPELGPGAVPGQGTPGAPVAV